jgi:hypothetical protein
MLHLFLLVCYCTVSAISGVSDTTSASVRVPSLLASLPLLVSPMLLIPCSRQYTAGRPNAAIPALVLLLHAVNLDKVCCWLLLPPSLSIPSLCVAGRCYSPELAIGGERGSATNTNDRDKRWVFKWQSETT